MLGSLLPEGRGENSMYVQHMYDTACLQSADAEVLEIDKDPRASLQRIMKA